MVVPVVPAPLELELEIEIEADEENCKGRFRIVDRCRENVARGGQLRYTAFFEVKALLLVENP